MEKWPTLEDQIKAAGIYYPRSYDIAYRVGYCLQSIGSIVFFIFYFIKRIDFLLFPLILFNSGIALSSIYLLVWKAEIKRFILRMTFFGIALQIIGYFISPINPFYSEKLFFLGLGLTLVGGAGLVGKEAYCFGFVEGWILLVLYPLAIIPNLFGFASYKYDVVIILLIAIFQLSFLRRKLSQPLLKKCEGNVCGLPEGLKEDE
jgi:uncharacterized integral membrane protein